MRYSSVVARIARPQSASHQAAHPLRCQPSADGGQPRPYRAAVSASPASVTLSRKPCSERRSQSRVGLDGRTQRSGRGVARHKGRLCLTTEASKSSSKRAAHCSWSLWSHRTRSQSRPTSSGIAVALMVDHPSAGEGRDEAMSQNVAPATPACDWPYRGRSRHSPLVLDLPPHQTPSSHLPSPHSHLNLPPLFLQNGECALNWAPAAARKSVACRTPDQRLSAPLVPSPPTRVLRRQRPNPHQTHAARPPADRENLTAKPFLGC
jgi:hypothetical protein